MSSYFTQTKHPETGEYKLAYWLDNHFGGHCYGIQFEGEEKIYRSDERKWETKESYTTGDYTEPRFTKWQRFIRFLFKIR